MPFIRDSSTRRRHPLETSQLSFEKVRGASLDVGDLIMRSKEVISVF